MEVSATKGKARVLLHISASPRGADSHSRRLGGAFRDRLAAALPGLLVRRRDLGAQPLPYPDAGFARANVTPDAARTAEDRAALALSELLIAELAAADMLLIDTPMNNFTIPAALKTWIDLVVRPRRTFGYAPDGRKQGMLADRPVFLLVACGGTFGAGPAAQTDFLTPYLRYVLGCIGLADLRPLLLERLTRGAEEVARAEAMAAEWMAAQLAGLRGG